MPKKKKKIKKKKKGDLVINITEIFRNPQMQKEAMKGCKKLKPRKHK